MQPQELEIIHADISIAKSLLYDNSGAANNPYMLNQAAYHSGQAIEKCLKAILLEAGELVPALSKSHSIEALVVNVEVVKDGFIKDHPFIGKNAVELSKFNGLRYGVKGIKRNDAMVVYREARGLFQELENTYLKTSTREQYRANSIDQYNKMDRIELRQERT